MKSLAVFSWVVAGALFIAPIANAAETEVDRLLDLLVKKGIVTQDDAVGFRVDLAVKKQEDVSLNKVTAVPEWTERIKWSGDVRFRTRGDWGKTLGNVPGTATSSGTLLKNQRLQESVRGRFALEAKVNDFTYAGTRFAGGTSSRSTDDTLNGYFDRANTTFDQYYIRFDAPKDWTIKYGKYFSDLKLWAGKFANPFESTEMVWDTDISPEGIALQYVSPDIRTRVLPDLNVYANLGMLWLDESSAYHADPILWGYQIGAKTGTFGPLDSTLNVATTIYDFANLKNRSSQTNSALTNSRTWTGDGIGTAIAGTYKYGYNVLDLLINLDNETIGDYKFPHGLFFDFIYNTSVNEDALNKGLLIGGYVGKKKLKNAGDWKASGQWRFIERDAIPDFLPDSNFYGFGTYVSATTRPNVNGIPAGGGTNGKGIKLGLEYQLFKNTALNLSYYWMEPIKSWGKQDPYNQFLADVVTKF